MPVRSRTFPYLLLFSILVLSVLLSLGCERDTIPVGGDESAAKAVGPAYSLAPEVSLKTAAANLTEVAQIDASQAVLDPAALYATNCAACHQATGKGIAGVFPPLDASPYVFGDNVERLASIMIYGLRGPIKVLGNTYNGAMAGLGQTMNNEELAAVATYIRSSWSNSADPVGPEVFAASREKWGTRAMFTIEELGAEPE